MEINFFSKNADKYNCIVCDFITSNKYNYNTHILTLKHKINANNANNAILEMNGNSNVVCKNATYECNLCNFYSKNKTNYDKHLLTEKHKKNVTGESKEVKYICSQCNKEYLNNSGLWKHKKHCVVIIESEPEPEPLQNTFIPSNVITPQLFMDVFRESKDLQNVLIEQNKELQNKLLEKENQLLEQNKEYHKEIIELTKKQTTNINTQNNTNQQFNLQFFLNETCKDAMNIKDFVNSLKLTTDDFETTGKLGFVDGISRIFIKELNKIETEKLPLHCTDVKRGTVYIKDNDIWEKENNEKQKLKWTIDRIAELNLHQHEKWQEKYPVCRENNTDENQYFFKLASVALGGRGKEEQDKYREKIMRNVMKEIVLDKHNVVLK